MSGFLRGSTGSANIEASTVAGNLIPSSTSVNLGSSASPYGKIYAEYVEASSGISPASTSVTLGSTAAPFGKVAANQVDASTVNVDQLNATSIAGLVKVRQTPTLYISTTNVSVTATTAWTNAFATTFTPGSSASNLLVLAQVAVYHGDSNSRSACEIRVSRGATDNIVAGPTRTFVSSGNFVESFMVANGIDSGHGLTAETTFTVQARHAEGSTFAHVNFTSGGLTNKSYLTIWEVD